MMLRSLFASALALCLALLPSVASAQDEPAKAAPKADAKPTASDLIDKGMVSARSGDMAKALEHFEAAVKAEPDNRQALFFVGAASQDRVEKLDAPAEKGAMARKSADAMRAFRDKFKDMKPQEKGLLGMALYNDACARALDKKADEAFKVLVEAIDAGFDNAASLESDKDLASLRGRPDFAPLVAGIKAAKVAKVKAALKEFKPFPFTFDLPDLEGKAVKLADFKGKVTIVDFWGTWCPPCRMEIPHFVDLLKRHKEKGLAIVGINYEKGPKDKHKDLIASFVKENGINYPCVLGDEKTQERVPDLQGFPTTLFIDREGTVRLMLVGYTPLPELEAIVTTLLDEAPTKTTSR